MWNVVTSILRLLELQCREVGTSTCWMVVQCMCTQNNDTYSTVPRFSTVLNWWMFHLRYWKTSRNHCVLSEVEARNLPIFSHARGPRTSGASVEVSLQSKVYSLLSVRTASCSVYRTVICLQYFFFLVLENVIVNICCQLLLDRWSLLCIMSYSKALHPSLHNDRGFVD